MRGWVAFAKGNRTGGYRLPTVRLTGRNYRAALPRELGTGFASSVRELNAGNRALGLDEGGDASQLGNVLILPDSEVAVGDAPARLDGGRFGYHQSGATDSAAAQMDQVPVRGESVLARVFAHRRHGDSI